MSSITAANVALDLAAIGINLIVFFIVYNKTSVSARSRYIMVASILQLQSLSEALFVEFSEMTSAAAELKTYYIIIVVTHLIELTMLMLCIVTESDEKPHFSGRHETISIKMIVGAFLPVIVALTLEILFHGSGLHIVNIALSFSFLIVCEIIESERRKDISDKEQTLNIRQAKLMTEQMQPHFIYNSLMSIHYLIYTDPEKAASCIEDFTGYLRGNIDALTSEELIPFSKELEHIDQYISLEKASTDRAFEVEFELNEKDFKIPALTVQPIVENAVKHGALSRKDGTGKVVVTTENVGQFVRITVADNGIGAAITDKQKQHRNVGLSNARSRIQTQCGGTLTINYGENGTRAVITIPKEGI